MVYPRVCGGTRCASQHHTVYPRVCGGRSIARRVYPRVCGGTGPGQCESDPAVLLSPRVRGNRWASSLTGRPCAASLAPSSLSSTTNGPLAVDTSYLSC